MTQRAPLIVVILGATACGKSRLAIELARRFGGEIISADSMQIYKGLDIVTNKVTEEEQSLAKHHMINISDPTVRFSVVDFRDKALDIIANLHKRNQLPIIVGGTNYYIESLLWKRFLIGSTREATKRESDETSKSHHNQPSGETIIDAEKKLLDSLPSNALHSDDELEDVEKFFSKPIYNDAFANVDATKLWKILEKVDPKAAHYYHPHNKRRVIRSLQIIQRNGKNYTDLLEEMNKSKEEGLASLGGPLRFTKTCVIYLHCENEILDKIVNERVDQMLNRGLLAELGKFHEDYNRQRVERGKPTEYDKGIFQTIGFKEFHNYLTLEPEIKKSEEGNKILRSSIEAMKMVTRRYARKQSKWVRRRFLQSGPRDLPQLFKLTTVFNEDDWIRQVQKPAFDIVESFVEGRDLSQDSLTYRTEPEFRKETNEPGIYKCEVCDRTLIGTLDINAHLDSRVHKKNVSLNERKKAKIADALDTTDNQELSPVTEGDEDVASHQ